MRPPQGTATAVCLRPSGQDAPMPIGRPTTADVALAPVPEMPVPRPRASETATALLRHKRPKAREAAERPRARPLCRPPRSPGNRPHRRRIRAAREPPPRPPETPRPLPPPRHHGHYEPDCAETALAAVGARSHRSFPSQDAGTGQTPKRDTPRQADARRRTPIAGVRGPRGGEPHLSAPAATARARNPPRSAGPPPPGGGWAEGGGGPAPTLPHTPPPTGRSDPTGHARRSLGPRTLTASRRLPAPGRMRERLRETGEPPTALCIAVARRLPTFLDAMAPDASPRRARGETRLSPLGDGGASVRPVPRGARPLRDPPHPLRGRGRLPCRAPRRQRKAKRSGTVKLKRAPGSAAGAVG